MPLASVEEWRARIGSCWCALARQFKTSKSPGNYRSFAALSGSVMLQAIYALMAMVLALTRDAAVVFIRGAKSVNGCVNDCRRQIKNNVRPRGVLMMLILLLQATTFIQSSLLLRSGDIESNPGPGIYPDLDYDDVDNSTVLTSEDNFCKVHSEIIGIKPNYYEFGIQLGLPLREMDAVQKAFHQDISQAFIEVLQIFLKHRYNIQEHGPPTWRKLVEAVDSPAGGNNHALAKKIAKDHPLLTKSHPSAPEETPVREATYVVIETMASIDHPGSIVQRCRDTMAAYYRRKVDDRAWPPVKSTNFVNLALIGNQTSWRRTVQESVDEIIGDKTTTSYHSMVADNCIGTFTLLEGRPGSGKTVLMNKISCDWAKGEILKSSLLIFVPLRRLREKPDRELATLLRVACSALPQSDINELASHISKTQGDRIVFAFDGFDEYVPYYNIDKGPFSIARKWYDIFRWNRKSEEIEYIQVSDDIFKLLNGNTLTKSTIFVTSRPAACNDIREYAKKRIEVLGFFKPQIIEYVNYYFSTDKPKAQQLVTHLEHHPNLMNMAYLPLHCAMLAFLFEDDTFLPETETEFYEHFTLSTLLRSLRRQQGSTRSITTTITSFDQLPQREKTIFDKVCKLAFNATVNSKQVFTSADIESILPGTDSEHARKDVSDLGLIVTDRYFMRFGLDDTYTFLHLTFQEYLGAIYIAELSESERMQIIQKHKNKENLSVVWRFLCGKMDFSQTNTMVTFENIMTSTAMKTKLEKLHCCFETQRSSACSYITNAFNGRLEFSENNFTPSDCAAIGYTISKSDFQSMICLIFDKCSFSTEGALDMLQKIGDHPLSLTISNCPSISVILDCFSKCHIPSLQVLNLSNNCIGDTGAQALADSFKHCVHMKKLILSCNGIENAGIQALVEGIKHCPMEGLNFGSNRIGSVGARALADCLKHCANMKELNLSDNHIDDAQIQALAEGIKHCPMERLNFGSNRIGSVGARALADCLKYFANMKELNLSDNNIDDARIQALAEGIKHCPMERLNFGSNRISSVGARALADCLKHCANMNELNLSHNNIDDTGIQALAEGIKHSPMERLNFGSNRIGSIGARALADCLKHCANMKELNLSANNIDDTGMQALTEGIKHCPMERLNFRYNKMIGIVGAQALADCLEYCANMKELNLRGNNIGDNGTQLLVANLKHCAGMNKLDLSKNDVEDSGIQTLVEATKHCPNMKELNLDKNFLSDGAVAPLIEVIEKFKNLEKLSLKGNCFTISGVSEINSATLTAQKNRVMVLRVNMKNQRL